jgi:tryptophanyl-tRNA synthetase
MDFDSKQLSEYEERYRSGGVGDVEIKKVLYEYFLQYFKPFRQRKNELEGDLVQVHTLRETGSGKARAVAALTIQGIKRACGI